jgi:adenine-specific DNA-methyltransferase
MRLTDFHTRLFAFELTKRCSTDSLEKLAGALVDAQVDLNPHQVEAALFAFKSPLSRGALLADEVGLGKTIEAGLVISQHWAERKRRILVITPANLRKQWHQEMQEKFFLPCSILESKSYNHAVKHGNFKPFAAPDSIVICSYQFAKGKAAEVNAMPWDLVVIDEAHRLRNVYRPSNVIANTLKLALAPFPKLLLTATPLQNSLLELFGLVSFIDEHAFGDLRSFREQFSYIGDDGTFAHLKARLQPICHRTLRRQVTAYVPYTKRFAMVERFTPAESEDRLYNAISDYLRRDNLQALPASQRSLMTLVLRKLLASSTFAIAGALDTLIARLHAKLEKQQSQQTLEEQLDEDYEALDETAEEWTDDPVKEPMSVEEVEALRREVADLEAFRDLAVSIRHNAKGEALVSALTKAFAEARRLRAAEKAIIFTESRKTQDYLQRLLADSKQADGIVLFNGSNTDPRSREIYKSWVERHAGTDRVTGSRTADMRSAIVDYFREEGRIMIATEAAAEGINLQFCSLVVNYDLPWNPQRIEQRIGRCHRYGQKHDVVVVNFLNSKNEADQRVYELLEQKFSLFDGVFGASDEVLGAIESGVDFEKRIAAIYQRCRTSEQIKAGFDQLQTELSAQINESMTRTRQQLLEHFDAEVHDKLRISLDESRAYLNRYELLLMQLTKHELADAAAFADDFSSFDLRKNPFPDIDAPVGRYELPRRSGDAHLYRLGHPLAQRLVSRAKGRELPPAEITFDLTNSTPSVAALRPLVGGGGEFLATQFTVESLDQTEDHLLIAAVTDAGDFIPAETARRLFTLKLHSIREVAPAFSSSPVLGQAIEGLQKEVQSEISGRNAKVFELEADKLDGWADDLKVALERDIKELDRHIKEAKRASKVALTLEEKLAGQKQIKALEGQRNTKRRSLFDAQDEIDTRREELIAAIEAKLRQRTSTATVVSFRWQLV